MVVEKFAGGFLLERFAFHDVTPMAGRVADAQKNRLVLRARLGEGLIVPREPVHGVVLVLEQVGRFFAGKAIGVFGRGGIHAATKT